jgi:hypothetical protein
MTVFTHSWRQAHRGRNCGCGQSNDNDKISGSERKYDPGARQGLAVEPAVAELRQAICCEGSVVGAE